VFLDSKLDLHAFIRRSASEAARRDNNNGVVGQDSDVAPPDYRKRFENYKIMKYVERVPGGRTEASNDGLGKLGAFGAGSPSNKGAITSVQYKLESGKLSPTPIRLPSGVVNLGNVYDMERRSTASQENRRGDVDKAIATLADVQSALPGVRVHCARTQPQPGVNVQPPATQQGINNTDNCLRPQYGSDVELPEFDDYGSLGSDYYDQSEDEPEPVDLCGTVRRSEVMVMDREQDTLWKVFRRWLYSLVISEVGRRTDWVVQGDNVRYPTGRIADNKDRMQELKLFGLIKMHYSYIRSEPFAHELTGHDLKGGRLVYGKLLDTLIMEHLSRKVDDNLLRYLYSYTVRHLKDHTAFEVDNNVAMHTAEIAFQFLLKKWLDAPSLLGRTVKSNPDAFGIRLN